MRAVGSDELGSILEPLRRGRCVLCLGGELAADGSLRRLIGKLIDTLPESADARALLEKRPLMAADHTRRRLGDKFVDELRRLTTSVEVAEPLRMLGGLPFSAVLTTSYDPAIERAFARGGMPPPVFTPTDGAALREHGRTRFVFKLLGDPARPETVVWGAADLQAALSSGGYASLEELFKTRSFLLLGFDWADAELWVLLDRLLSSAGRGQQHHAVLSNLSPLERDELQAIYGIRVLDGIEAGDFAAQLYAAMADPRRSVPDDDDLDAWLALLADDPTRPEIIDRFDGLEERLRRRGDPEKLVELWVGRVAVEPDPRRRAELLNDAAQLLENDLHDPARAFAARLAAYGEAPSRSAWDKLEGLAAATHHWAELANELTARLKQLPKADQADGCARVAAIRDEELDDADAALAATEAALALDPGHRDAIAVRLGVLRRTGRWKELSEALGRAVLVEESLSERAAIYTQLAEVFESHLNDPRQAVACWRLALEADPYATGARDALENLLAKRGEIVELIELLENRVDRAAPAEQIALRRRIAALCEERLGDRALALKHWEAVRALAPADGAALAALARLYEQTGRARDLLGLYADAAGRADSDRDRAEVLRRLAAEWERQPGGLPKAAETWEALLELEPGDAAALGALERCYRAENRLQDLAAALERHLALVPTETRAPLLVQLGQTRESLGQPEHAHGAYLEALRLEPQRADLFDALVRLYEASGAYDRVVALCEERAQRSPADVKVGLYAKAAELVRDRLQDPARAETLYAAALEVDPHHVPSLLGMHQLYRRQGDLGKAARLMVEAIDSSQNRLLKTRLSVEVGELYERIDDPATALALYRRALALDPDHVDAAERAVELLWRAKKWDEIIPILEPLARREGLEQLSRVARLGVAALAIGDRERAQRAFRRALELDPNHLDALRGLASLLYDAGAHAEAQVLYQTLLRQHEAKLTPAEQVEAYHRLGVCELKLGHPESARERFAIACAIDPTHRPSLLMQLELGTQDPAKVIEAKKALLATAQPREQVKLYQEIGDLYLDRLEDPVQAVGAWEAGLAVQPDDVRLLHRCMNVYVEQKAWSQAMGMLERLIRGQPKQEVRARYHYTAGIICLEHLGRFADAADHLWASVEGDPGYKRAAKALEEMLRNHKSWKELARFWTFSLKALEPIDTDDKRAEQLRLWTSLGELHADKLRDPDSAIVAYEVARRLDPTPARRQKLATACLAAGGKHLPMAIAEHQALLDDDPARVVSYRALKELYEQTDHPGRAESCALALKCLLPEEEGAPAAALALTEPRRPLTAELIAALRHADEDAELSGLFAFTATVIMATRAQRDRQPLSRKRLVAESDSRPFARALRRAAAAYGMPAPHAYAAPDQAEPALLVLAVEGQVVTPVLSVGKPLLDDRRAEGELAFDLSRKVAQLRPEHVVRYLLPLPHELAHLVEAALALAAEVAAGSKPTGELAKTTEALKRQLPPPALDQVVTLGHRFRARGVHGDKAALRWLHASDLTLSRMAFVAAPDLPRSARMLKHEPPPPTALPAERRILDLIRASVGDPMFAALKHVR